MTSTYYTLDSEEVVGFLGTTTSVVAHMPRADFMSLVEDTLDSDEKFEPIRSEMLQTAQGMVRFPMHTWLDDKRGCGCVVGEYLVARRQVDEFNDEANTLAARRACADEFKELRTVSDRVAALPHGDAIWHFGNRIDGAVEAALADRIGDEGYRVQVVVIDDD